MQLNSEERLSWPAPGHDPSLNSGQLAAFASTPFRAVLPPVE